jgi:imidazolonepropionase-like amidohydrolase
MYKINGFDKIGDDAFLDSSLLNRRGFLKRAALVSAWFLTGATGIGSLAGCGDQFEWEAASFPKVLLHNFGLFDGIKNQLQQNLVLLIKGDKIQGIEPKGDLSLYKNYKIVDLQGRTVLPGLIDNHVHITVPFMYRINKYRSLADKNEIPGPRVISSLSPIAARDGDKLGAPEKAPYFTNPIIKWIIGGNYAERPTNVKEIKTACEEMIKLGAQWLKTLQQDHPYSYSPRKLPNHPDEGYRAIIEIGKKHGIKCALHEPLLSGFKKGVDLGFNTLEHMPMDAVIPDEYVEKFMQQDMAMMPTIMIYGDSFVINKILQLIKTRGDQYLMPEALKQMSARLNKSKLMEKKKLSETEYNDLQFDNQYALNMFPNVISNLKKLHRMGATIGAGSDIGGTASGFFGRFTDELKHYADAGISNFEILQMATSINARIIDMQDKIGLIKEGKSADIIAVDGNPLKDIAALDKIKMVMKGGIFIKIEDIEFAV